MAKVIIKPKVYLPDESFKSFINMINDQLKNDIIYVPYYCDVYIIDGDVEIQKDVKIETASENKECSNCKYEKKSSIEKPCRYCCHNIINGHGPDKWEAKDNG